jgi:ribosomal protein L11 methyltransferase
MTEWVEVSVTADGEGAEAAADLLRRYVPHGIAVEQIIKDGEAWSDQPIPIEGLIVRGYIPHDEHLAQTRKAIEEGIYYLGRLYPIPEPEFRIVREQDWAEAWKKGFVPIRVGKHLMIKPTWANADILPDDVVIDLDPGMAFGTGTHPTTQLCLQACEWFCRPGTNMLDLGTGSGILAIAAAKLGCFRVLGRDIDEVAVEAAQRNVIQNQVDDRVTIQHGSLAGMVTSGRHFDIGMANITANVLVQMSKEGLQHCVWPGSTFVFSGIIQEQMQDVVSALDACDLPLLGHREMGDWVMLITRRRTE